MLPSCFGMNSDILPRVAESICTTIRPEFRVPTDLFLLYAHEYSTKIYGPLLFILSSVHDHSTQIKVHTDLFLYIHDHSTKI